MAFLRENADVLAENMIAVLKVRLSFLYRTFSSSVGVPNRSISRRCANHPNYGVKRPCPQVLSVKGLQDTLLWLNDWPGGLKLNYELGKFFCDAFLWFTSVWEQCKDLHSLGLAFLRLDVPPLASPPP